MVTLGKNLGIPYRISENLWESLKAKTQKALDLV
jgi:hypothetical protein